MRFDRAVGRAPVPPAGGLTYAQGPHAGVKKFF